MAIILSDNAINTGIEKRRTFVVQLFNVGYGNHFGIGVRPPR